MPQRSRSRRRTIAIGLALLGLAGLGLGSAAQLNLEADTLGAGVDTVASCQGDDPIRVGFTTEFQADEYRVSEVVLSNIHSRCAGKKLGLSLLGDPDTENPDGKVLYSPTLSLDTSTDMTVEVDPAVSAEAITKIAVVIAD